ncbi:TonB family protein [Pinirhizobacter sp.]|jgi:protein TonB|uniref:energy transducer TonB n=1 Tax=Pinirhizobacter sp. TaxID=2950432 RepID=UPI002F3E5518
MHKRRPVFAPRLVRGSTSQMLIAVIAVFFALAVAAYFLVYLPNKAAVEQINGAPTVGQAPAAATSVAAPTDVDRLSVDQLLSEARKAMNDRRLVAPAGNNAYEFYLKALERQPGNAVAADALRETFTFASGSAESAINQRDFAEAQREIDLLAKADPENYTLTILRSKLDAQRKTLDREQQQLLDQQRQAALAQQQQKEAAARALAEQQAAAETARQQAAAAATKAAAPRATAPGAATGNVAAVTHATPSDDVKITDAVLTHRVNPRYPTAAQRANQEGWVDVEFTVSGTGGVDAVSIVDAQPKHVFDRSAIDAVSKWEFTPATRNGEPMPVTMRRRIEFKLGR